MTEEEERLEALWNDAYIKGALSVLDGILETMAKMKIRSVDVTTIVQAKKKYDDMRKKNDQR